VNHPVLCTLEVARHASCVAHLDVPIRAVWLQAANTLAVLNPQALTSQVQSAQQSAVQALQTGAFPQYYPFLACSYIIAPADPTTPVITLDVS
jgi:hypothetical protein